MSELRTVKSGDDTDGDTLRGTPKNAVLLSVKRAFVDFGVRANMSLIDRTRNMKRHRQKLN